MTHRAICAEELSKRYQIGAATGGQTLRETLSSGVRNMVRRGFKRRRDHIWALRDVSFDVGVGEVLGVIGANGAGKTTLLKVLSRITEPTSGRAEIHGRVGSLLEVGTGFHPELTGRENIYLNGAILGMRRAEIARKFDEIVEFSGVERFLETPVKRYSSGMYVRLAFSVAAHLEPEILVVDEVLAVGDASFQKKCAQKMEHTAGEGHTVLLVSHNMAIVRSLCSRCLVLSEGRVIGDGATDEMIDCYLGSMTGATGTTSVDLRDHANRLKVYTPSLERISLLRSDLQPGDTYRQSEDIVVEVTFDARKAGYPVAGTGFMIETATGTRVGAFNTYMALQPPFSLPNAATVRFTLTSPRLLPGRYFVSPSLGSHQYQIADRVEKAIAFEVVQDDLYGTGFLTSPKLGMVALECDVSIDPAGSDPADGSA